MLIQRLFECRARAVVIFPDVCASWFPLMQLGCLDTMHIAALGEQGVLFVRDHHLSGEQLFVYPSACLLDFTKVD